MCISLYVYTGLSVSLYLCIYIYICMDTSLSLSLSLSLTEGKRERNRERERERERDLWHVQIVTCVPYYIMKFWKPWLGAILKTWYLVFSKYVWKNMYFSKCVWKTCLFQNDFETYGPEPGSLAQKWQRPGSRRHDIAGDASYQSWVISADMSRERWLMSKLSMKPKNIYIFEGWSEQPKGRPLMERRRGVLRTSLESRV